MKLNQGRGYSDGVGGGRGRSNETRNNGIASQCDDRQASTFQQGGQRTKKARGRSIEREPNLSLQNIPLWHKAYLELVIFFKIADTGEALETEKSPFCKRLLHLQGKSPSIRVSSSLYQEEKDDSQSLKTLNKGQGNGLNLHNNLTLIHCAFSGHLP